MSGKTMWDLEASLMDEIREEAEAGGLLEEDYPEDRIVDMVDEWVPIYTSELLEVAASDPELAVVEPELGPAFDGTPTPVNIIAANIYERLMGVGFSFWYDLQRELEEEEVDLP